MYGVCWFVGSFVCWFVGLLVCLLVGWFVGLLVCWFVGLLVGWLLRWLVRWLNQWEQPCKCKRTLNPKSFEGRLQPSPRSLKMNLFILREAGLGLVTSDEIQETTFR